MPHFWRSWITGRTGISGTRRSQSKETMMRFFICDVTKDTPLPPVKGAFVVEYTHTEKLAYSDPAQAYPFADNTDWWYGHGVNHRIQDGKITREVVRKAWYVDLNTLDELIALV